MKQSPLGGQAFRLSLGMTGKMKPSQFGGPPNLSGTARFEKRPDFWWFTNRPYELFGEIVGFETGSDARPSGK